MTKKTLSLKVKRTKDPKPLINAAKDVPHGDPKMRFSNGIAVNPYQRICLEKGAQHFTTRAIDLVTPIGMGQRGLIVAPPGCGKTTLLKHVCQAVGAAYPEIKLYALLIDERPEEVTDFKRSVPAQVHASSSDESYEHHVSVANDLLDTARRQAGEGHDVMIVIDSLTRLSRVHNASVKGGGRTMSGGIDARALEIPRKLFGAARKIENGGSLTILATILVDTGSRMDQVIFEEFKGTGNMEMVLDRKAAELRLWPAINLNASGTRKEELLLSGKYLEGAQFLRRALAGQKIEDAAEAMIERFSQTKNNDDFLKLLSR
ncbi:MAG TPA: transcription termination factor Rho [Opitutae bacterium]|nr:transcription termination factor Rho [Opitutae bacterium]